MYRLRVSWAFLKIIGADVCRVRNLLHNSASIEFVPVANADPLSVAPGLPNARWIAIRLLDGDYRVRQALLSGELAGIATSAQRAADLCIS